MPGVRVKVCIVLFARVRILKSWIPVSVKTAMQSGAAGSVCHKRFTTQESIVLSVVKRSGVTEPFDRKKVISGVSRACRGRAISEEDLNRLGQKVEEDLRAKGQAEIRSEEVGKAILQPLRDLDDVAYLRFASVYKHFDSMADYEAEIDDIRLHKPGEGSVKGQ